MMYIHDNLPHSLVLQAFTALALPEQDPPCFSVTTLDLVLYIVPLPQVFVQEENSLQGPQTQGTENKQYQNSIENQYDSQVKGSIPPNIRSNSWFWYKG